MKDELVKSVAHAAALGLKTRIVSNGSWAKRIERAGTLCAELAKSGLGELNLSTGRDHQEFVPESSIINAAEAAIASGIDALITVETDTMQSNCYLSLRSSERIQELMKKPGFRLVNNYWMPFHADAPARKQEADLQLIRKGCEQVFDNLVVTPHDNLSACCGLTLEYIAEMRLGRNDGSNMKELFEAQADDFLKYWLRVDGPYAIIENVMGDAAPSYLDGVVHGCQACAILHKTPAIRSKLTEVYQSHIENVLTRFEIARAAASKSVLNQKEIAHGA
ncbi:TPA: hypothetical protein HH296_16525 [Xanthomonas vasicola pv. zeae]|uniref:hypothetical protein n=1 Tax=Xanthomonas vasicola TaxID=56459 RepID=UPI000E3175D6|nr:hypothetical protein [Xanthomonas vasicola]HHZ24008.1 hypothetical protein [Xanthomonas vasicola pv. zeae]HHZ27219.1 hypothetical protein [Xanthomonas vasicola pv. zeae]HHZ35798.1 hypothetical protein [Xanthomonas vasicola pv. zeae]HHZ39939.1 hypothetical protein [Xanthomonas vasicola pv. zeae]HHZ43822.1 hypothetical protein [Xanthomonas vasicola pv. zeae]